MKSLFDLRADALEIFREGIRAANPETAIQRALKLENDRLKILDKSYDLSLCDGIYVVGGGKAGGKMAQAIETILGDRVEAGVVNVKYGYSVDLDLIKINEAGHPLPDERGMRGTKEMMDLLSETGKRDLVLCLLSGGASALMPSPAEGLTLQDKQQTTQLLLQCGATIQEINAVRKHLSQIKGGRLAKLAYPSTLISLILSDVIGDELDVIASGPTVPDKNTFGDCLRVLQKYGLYDKIPPPVRSFLEKGGRGDVAETPKPQDPVFLRVQNLIVGNNRLAIGGAKEKSDALGYHSVILSSFVDGESREVAKVHAAIAREILNTGNPVPKPACIISGGETTVTIRGQGAGGRNQEFALAAAMDISGLREVVILSGGTDGTDGPTNAAGAITDSETVMRANEMGMDPERYLVENDSYNFFHRLSDLLVTGPTLTNVMDLHLVLVG